MITKTKQIGFILTFKMSGNDNFCNTIFLFTEKKKNQNQLLFALLANYYILAIKNVHVVINKLNF